MRKDGPPPQYSENRAKRCAERQPTPRFEQTPCMEMSNLMAPRNQSSQHRSPTLDAVGSNHPTSRIAGRRGAFFTRLLSRRADGKGSTLVQSASWHADS